MTIPKMWENDLTKAQLSTLRKMGVEVIFPVSKALACGDTGIGALESVDRIIELLKRRIPPTKLHDN